MRGDLPSGTVTFLFTDVEGSTKLLHELGAEGYARALAEHRRVLRDAFTRHGGVEVDTQGDAFFVAFPTAPGALAAVEEMLGGLAAGPIRVRMGVHTGTPFLAEEGYVGPDVNRAARIAACGHGGQVLVSAATASLVAGDGLRDLGEHRLKDLSAPERIYQLGGGQFPQLKSLHQTNLPIPATPFLGRERELADIADLLASDDLRLLTLSGPGGTGKTRLALQAAAAAADAFPNGVWWVPLAPLRDPALVLETAARALGAQDGLADHIADKQLLLLFDNFEHVVDAAVELAGLLASCPNLHLLVTSRELLSVPGEQAYPVPPLEPHEGTELFVARVRATLPDFSPSDAVPELCARLENLPLALELAAARVRVLSPEQLLERLSGRLDLLKGGRGFDPRQQTLRATIEWSHELLDEGEQRLFARLAVFSGGCTLEDAEDVAEADLDVLQSLVDKSLLRHTEERFWMLETIREYAIERLEESGEVEALRRRHAEHFLALAEDAEPHVRQSKKEWLDLLDREHDNLRVALEWLQASAQHELALRLAGAAWRFWLWRGHEVEGRRRLETALDADTRPTPARAKALNGATVLANNAGDGAAAGARAEEALALYRTLGDAWGTAYSLFLLGQVVFMHGGDASRAQVLFEESLRLLRAAGDERYALVVTMNLAWTYRELGDLQRARALHEENLRSARAYGDERLQAMTLDSLSTDAFEDGRIETALRMLKESLRIWHDQGDPGRIADSLSRFAGALAMGGRAGTAARLLGCAQAVNEQISVSAPSYVVRRDEETLTAIRRQLDEAAFGEAWERGRALRIDEAVALALESSAGPTAVAPRAP